MRTVPMHLAKTKLTELVAAVERGERVLITRHGKPAAELVLPQPRKGGLDWEALEAYQRECGVGAAFRGADLDAVLAPMDPDTLFGPEWAHKFDYLVNKKKKP
jgi:antitoxin (DNA-binding transcriptional repressor) of toxin-antitoxin stability system